MNTTNPLIGDTRADTLNNVVESLNGLLALLSATHTHSGLCMLMQPIQSALEHATDHQE